jgi:hypothetical protein
VRAPVAASIVPPTEAPRCGDYVAIRGSRATIDTETDRVAVVGEVLVAGSAVTDLHVCIGENCVLVAGGRRMANGESARFSVAAHGRPGAFSVRCFPER